MKLLITIPFTTDNAVLAERLCDWIFQLAKRKQSGHCLLVCDQQVHAEMREKVKIAAEVAFVTVDLVVATVSQIPKQIPSHFWTNLMFRHASEHVSKSCRWPWLWMEPECVPVRDGWVGEISEAYEDQPKRYLGTKMAIDGSTFMARVGVYPPSAFYDFKDADQSSPFETLSGSKIVPKLGRTKLFQHLKIQDEEDVAKIREESCVVVGDSVGILIEKLREATGKKRKGSQ